MGLRKWSTTILRDKSGDDQTQVPAPVSATVYRQGATVAASVTVTGSPTSIEVYDTGGIAAGDNIQLGINNSKQMLVVSIDDATHLTARRVSALNIDLNTNDRLVPYGTKPLIYSDTAGAVELTNPVDADSHGYIELYCRASVFDVIVSGAAITSTLFTDNDGGPEPAVVDVTEFATFQDAIDATPDGGTLFVPAGEYTRNTVPAVVPMTITKRIAIVGEGRVDSDSPSAGTYLRYRNFGSEDVDSHLITINNFPNTNSFRLENLTLEGPKAAGSGCGLRVGAVHGAIIKNVNIRYTAGPCLSHELGSAQMVHWELEHCRFDTAYSGPLVKFEHSSDYAAAIRFYDCDFINRFGGRAVSCKRFIDNPVWDTCTFQTDQPDAADAEFLAFEPRVPGETNVVAYKPIIQNCYFDWVGVGQGPTPSSWFIKLKGAVIAAQITGNKLTRNSDGSALPTDKRSTSARFLYIDADTTNRGPYLLRVMDNYLILAGSTGPPTAVGTDDIKFNNVSFDITQSVFANNAFLDSVSRWNPMVYSFSSDANTYDPLIRLGDGGGRLKPRATGVTNWNAFPNKLAGDIIFDNTTGLLRCYSATDSEFHSMWPYFQAGDPPTGLPSGSRWAKGDQVVSTGSSKLWTCTTAGTIGGSAPTFKGVAIA